MTLKITRDVYIYISSCEVWCYIVPKLANLLYHLYSSPCVSGIPPSLHTRCRRVWEKVVHTKLQYEFL